MSDEFNEDQEFISDDEEEIIDSIIEMNRNMLNDTESPTRRAQHPKHHGCVTAIFKIRDDVPDHLQVGVFKRTGHKYEALIRFSNGTKEDDREKDAHGMAIKLLNVPGKKLLPGHKSETTHDFILVDHPVFFSGDLREYSIFNRHFGAILDEERNDQDVVDQVLGEIDEFFVKVWHGLRLKSLVPSLMKRAKKFSSQTPSSLLKTHYWSTTAYKLGNSFVKYMAIADQDDQRGVADENGLGADLSVSLKKGQAQFVFAVHEQSDRAVQSVEDPTTRWWQDDDERGGEASAIPLADITVTGLHERSEFLAQHLVFSPWNALEVHRPLGVINRIRRRVYERLAAERHDRNATSGTTAPEGFASAGSTDVPR